MNKKWFLAGLAIPAVVAVVALRTPSRAADHLDSPGATNDPAGDLTDVYSFLSPNSALGTTKHLVMVMDVTANAGSKSNFSDKIEYWFKVRQVINPTPGTLAANGSYTIAPNTFDFKCTFNAAVDQVTCAGQGSAASVTKTAPVDQAGATCGTADNVCVWAGKRSDPFFFDFAAFQTFNATGDASAFIKGPDGGPAGNNFFNTYNVLSIVLEVDVTNTFNGAAHDSGVGDAGTDVPYLLVAAETRRTGN